MYQEYTEQVLRISILTTLVLLIAVSLQQAAFAHRLAAMIGAAEPTARSVIASSVSQTVLASGDPTTALPATIATTAPACPTTNSNDPYCSDTIQVAATRQGGTGVASTTYERMPNYNSGTGYNYSTGTGGTPIQAHAVYSYVLKILNPKSNVIAQHRGIIGLTIINSTSTPVIVDAVADPNGNGMGGYDRQSTTGACAPGAGCSGTAQPTPQPGVGIDDTRIHGQLGTCANPAAPKLCNPTGQPTPTPAPRDNFNDTNVTNGANGGGWPH